MNDSRLLRYCPDLFASGRRKTREVRVGGVGVGGDNPIRIQSMITSDTRDTEACVKEVLGLAEAGCEIVRITAQTVKYAANLENIRDGVRAAGCVVPLVADIHFKPDAAMEAAKWVEKVRVNPGNFVDKKKFEVREYSDADYAEELERIHTAFVPLVERCQDLGRSMRIGTNHGSLSDRIMNRYGDSPLGMVESALEFVRIAREMDYHEIIFSMKASNPKVMIEAYRLLIARLDEEGPDWNYPIHLGVTEAGDGEDGRIKSAIGIGSLLMDGIGDTIRVSLTEDSVYEVPVAEALARPFQERRCGVSPQAVPLASRRQDLGADALSCAPDWERVVKRSASYLPHWEVEGGISSLTFRLADSLPKSVLLQFREEQAFILRKIELLEGKSGSRSCVGELQKLRDELRDLYERKIEPELHRGHGECWLGRNPVATLVRGALEHFDGERYELRAWCIMPNHVHALIKLLEGESLSKVLHSWKSFTAKEANKVLGRTGEFWQREYFDHLVRDGEDYRNQVRYILNNPVGSGEDAWVGSVYGDTWGEAVATEGTLAAGRHRDGLRQDATATSEEALAGEVTLAAGRHRDGLRQDAAATSEEALAGEVTLAAGRHRDGLRQDATATSEEALAGEVALAAGRHRDGLRQDATATSEEALAGEVTLAAGRHRDGLRQDAAATSEEALAGEVTLAAGRHRDGLRQDAAATPEDATATSEDAAATYEPSWDPFSFARRGSSVMEIGGFELGGDRTVRVVTTDAKWMAVGHKIDALGDFKPEIVLENSGVVALDPRDAAAVAEVNASSDPVFVTVADGIGLEVVPAFRILASVLDARHPILLKDVLNPSDEAHKDFIDTLLTAARNIGSLLCDGIGDAVIVQGEQAPGQSLRLSYNILQAAGTRIFKTDYVACPSCGRTLFNLQTTTQKIREATGHLKGVRIAVMGCIVNGPGEMADADFGYVGGAPGKINLYVGKEAVKFNIPEDEAVKCLIDLINEHGKWIDPPQREDVEV